MPVPRLQADATRGQVEPHTVALCMIMIKSVLSSAAVLLRTVFSVALLHY